MRMAEKEQQHRFEESTYIARSNARNIATGQIVATLVVAMVMGAAVLCAKYGQPLPATLLGGGGLVAIISAIIFGSKLKPRA